MYLAIIILPLLGSIVFGFFLISGFGFSEYANILALFTLFIIALTEALEGLTEFLDYHLYSKIPLTGTAADGLFDLPSVTGTYFLDEDNLLENGVADAKGAKVRDRAITNGIDPNESYQPYARNLARKLLRDRDGSSNLPSTILDRDQEFIKSVAPNCWPNYNANTHYLNSRVMRAYLNALQ